MKFPSKASLHIPKNRWARALLLCLALLLLLWAAMWVIVPRQLFTAPCSTLLYSSEGDLLGARIAPDGQWRFPATDSVPQKITECLITFEDKRFFYHPGVDPVAIVRAMRQNFAAGGVVSGGSTITMQLARIARGSQERTIYQKFVESCWALFLETKYSKRRILNFYASNAPFGGNVVGVETAAWRYFGRSAADLSWAESATLAVLPNSPALIHPGRNRDALKAKRDALLLRLRERGTIDQTEYELSCLEPLPQAPVPLPNEAPHLLERLAAGSPGTRIETSVQRHLQIRTQSIIDRWASENASNHIYNMCALIADAQTGEVLAYAGNVSFKGDESRGNSVDVITAERSTGSILKPLLYAGMLHDGIIMPGTLISDTPLNIDGFMPQNYDKNFYGAVPASRAIERSLNVPLVRMLVQYNTGRFMSLLRRLGMTTLRYSEDHYGASIILGGAEGTLWDIAGMYASLARTLSHYTQYNGLYDERDIHPLTPYPAPEDQNPIVSVTDPRLSARPLLSAASIWFAFEAMAGLNRPEEEAEWQQFSSMRKVAWKTGTSYGGRDAWAVGVTPRYVVGVWAGNASGEGRPGLTGVGTAAPALFEIFSLLPTTAWFDTPLDEMERVAVCRRSGHKASQWCEPVDSIFVPSSSLVTELCPYHRAVQLSADGRYRVNSSCEDISRMRTVPWFVLPPAQEYYYRRHNADYLGLPPWREGCIGEDSRQIDIIYPEHGAILYLPKGFTGEYEKFIFKAAHSRPRETIYWHIDDSYLGSTDGDHTMVCELAPGEHVLSLVDGAGNSRRILFTVK